MCQEVYDLTRLVVTSDAYHRAQNRYSAWLSDQLFSARVCPYKQKKSARMS